MNPNMPLPPAGIYDVQIVSWGKRDYYYEVSFQIARGRHIGYSFPERIPVVHIPNNPERALYDGFLSLAQGRPDQMAAAHLVRRCVHGIKTLGLKKWGWR